MARLHLAMAESGASTVRIGRKLCGPGGDMTGIAYCWAVSHLFI